MYHVRKPPKARSSDEATYTRIRAMNSARMRNKKITLAGPGGSTYEVERDVKKREKVE